MVNTMPIEVPLSQFIVMEAIQPITKKDIDRLVEGSLLENQVLCHNIVPFTTRNFAFCNCRMQLKFSCMCKIQLHATHATANLCSCIRHVAQDMQLHATLRMQHIYMVLVYMFIHIYQSNVVAPYVQLSLQLHTTNQNMTHV